MVQSSLFNKNLTFPLGLKGLSMRFLIQTEEVWEQRIKALLLVNKGVVSKETVVLHRWGSCTQEFGFINGVDDVNWPPYRDSKSWVSIPQCINFAVDAQTPFLKNKYLMLIIILKFKHLSCLLWEKISFYADTCAVGDASEWGLAVCRLISVLLLSASSLIVTRPRCLMNLATASSSQVRCKWTFHDHLLLLKDEWIGVRSGVLVLWAK